MISHIFRQFHIILIKPKKTPLFSQILVAIEGSEYAFKDAKYALDLAKSLSGAHIYAITVISNQNHRI
jgi:nucleotide-binding universal stress UspA family protein